MILSDEQFDKYRNNLLILGTAFIKVIYQDGELKYEVLDNKDVTLRNLECQPSTTTNPTATPN